jgi:hypothetical protein
MGALSILKLIDTVKTEIEAQRRRGDNSGKVTHKAICNRLKKQDLSLKESSLRVQVSRYLKKALEEGYLERESIGRYNYYSLTSAGTAYHIQNQDLLDKTRKWIEESSKYGYMSYAISNSNRGIIQEKRNEYPELDGKEEIEKLIRIIKEKNPKVMSIYFRLE